MWIVYICLIGILGFGVWQCWICRVPLFLFAMGSSRGLEDGASVWGDAAGMLFEVS